TAGGNFVLGDYVFGSALGSGFFIADVSDPTAPVLVYNSTGETSETPFSRKAEVIAHPDGRRTLVLATQSNGMHFWDVTDPANAVWASSLEFTRNHYVAVVPGTELVFNNPSAGTGGDNALVDAHDPYNPVILGTYGSYGCHGTTFQGKPGDALFRGYCAGIQRTEVWDMKGLNVSAPHFGIELLTYVDIADNPVSGTPITNPPIPSNPTGITTTPVRSLHHFATASADGSILIIGDEHRGGSNPGACFVNDPLTGKSTPLGALWFFDISNPADPQMLSWISPPLVPPESVGVITNPPSGPEYVGQQVGKLYETVPNCTAHFGQVVPGEDKIVLGWYSAGVLLIDFSDPTAPVILDQYQPEGVNTWSARISNGYVFTGDMNRGMEVLRLA
ncbi:MAG: LVIVD repeat-containing protein, partial [Thermoplasmatota archaeon]